MTKKSTEKLRNAYAVADIMLSVSRLMASRDGQDGLNAVQWAALRFVAGANVSARNIGAFARLQNTTHSSASQTMTSLTKGGYLRKIPGEDRRVVTLELTPKAQKALENDPIHGAADLLATLSNDQLGTLSLALEKLVRAATRG
jgi:DNA-binding MarR family transcriptional regulator